jgi:hypothetical protein
LSIAVSYRKLYVRSRKPRPTDNGSPEARARGAQESVFFD